MDLFDAVKYIVFPVLCVAAGVVIGLDLAQHLTC